MSPFLAFFPSALFGAPTQRTTFAHMSSTSTARLVAASLTARGALFHAARSALCSSAGAGKASASSWTETFTQQIQHDNHPQRRAFAWSTRHSQLRGYATRIEVPAMGDSITEGSIATVDKPAGSQVAADDIIVQIETDKVTIDVRAPESGTITEILVAEGETVVVGQQVASLEPGAAPEGAAPAHTSAAGTAEAAPAAAPSSPAHAAVADVVEGERIPSLRFPLRRLADGTRISALLRAEQDALHGGTNAASTAAAAVLTPRVGGAHLIEPPSLRDLTEDEMEMIELGGCLP